ncbi:MAG TPA: hypothetical protein VNG53_03790 [Bacteroidia bacterium]|nr:hypothetical protein [Bacteroidia bacterium]
MKKNLLLLFVFSCSIAFSQSVYAPLNNDYNSLIDRYEIKSGTFANDIFTSVKPYLRNDVAQFADKLSADSALKFSSVDKRNLNYLRDDNWEWSNIKDSGNTKRAILKIIYQKKNAFFEYNSNGLQFQLNPVACFSYGKDMETIPTSINTSNYINSRGFEVRGTIDNKIGFYTFLTDNQAAFPTYMDNRIAETNGLPGEGFWKQFGKNGYDFFSASGYIDFHVTKHIVTQFGQGSNIIGNGYRSLELSNFSPNYLFLKVDTKFGKFDYVNIFAQMVAEELTTSNGSPLGDVNYPRKYMALHYLTYNITKNLNIGAFENITFGNTDTINNRQYELNYLNPIIFYKAIENGLGAPDKDHIGFDIKWNFLHHFSLYGTVFLDEFNIDQIRANTGWWANKQAGQIGLKYIDVAGIKNLDLQLEANIVPPYTYTHFSYSNAPNNYYANFANYSNYNQTLADPNGANFKEFIGILKYQPFYRFTFTGKLFYTQIGLDKNGQDYGSNILLNSNNRVSNYGNFIGQGAKTTIVYGSFTTTYQLMHNMFLDLTLIMRNENSSLSSYNMKDNIGSFTFRWNIAQRLNEF